MAGIPIRRDRWFSIVDLCEKNLLMHNPQRTEFDHSTSQTQASPAIHAQIESRKPTTKFRFQLIAPLQSQCQSQCQSNTNRQRILEDWPFVLYDFFVVLWMEKSKMVRTGIVDDFRLRCTAHYTRTSTPVTSEKGETRVDWVLCTVFRPLSNCSTE